MGDMIRFGGDIVISGMTDRIHDIGNTETHNFSYECLDNSIEELIEMLRSGEPDETEMATWEIDKDQWKAAIAVAIAHKMGDEAGDYDENAISFAEACCNDNTIKDLEEGLLDEEPCKSDMEAWEINEDQWKAAISMALAEMLVSVMDER